MRTHLPRILGRVVFSFFISLFFLTPICTIFVPFCTITWTVGVAALAAFVYVATAWWRPADLPLRGTHSIRR